MTAISIESLGALSRSDQEEVVLTKALRNAAERLGISPGLLAKILGVSASTVSRLYAGRYRLKPARKEWELALLFVRLYRALFALVGGDADAQRWLQSRNHELGGVTPLALLQSVDGLTRVLHYLDAYRARL